MFSRQSPRRVKITTYIATGVAGLVAGSAMGFFGGLAASGAFARFELTGPRNPIELRVTVSQPSGPTQPQPVVPPAGSGSPFLEEMKKHAEAAVAKARSTSPDPANVPQVAAEEFVRSIGTAAQIPKIAVEEFVKGVSSEAGKSLVGFFAELVKSGFGLGSDKERQQHLFATVLRQELVVYVRTASATTLADCPTPMVPQPARHVRHVAFDINQSRLTAAGSATLNEVRELAKQQLDSILLLSGNTDTTGSLGRNSQLARQRVEAARAHLVKEGGIAPSRIFVSELATHSLPVMTTAGTSEPRNRAVTVAIRN